MESQTESSGPGEGPNPQEQIKRLRATVGPLKLELRRHFLSARHRVIAETLVELSFGRGLASVQVPKLEMFTDLTGISKPHVHSALRELHELRIVRVQQKQGKTNYMINPDSEAWKVRAKVSLESIVRATRLIDELNGVDQLVLGVAEQVLRGQGKPGAENQLLFPGVTESETGSGWFFPELT
jgi:hypothetical protein